MNRVLKEEELDDVMFNVLETMVSLERRHEELHEADWKSIYVLQLLHRKGAMSVGDIAGKLGAKAFTASRLVSRLVDRGLIRRERDGDDGRVVMVSIAKAGAAKLDSVERDNRKVAASAFDGMGQEELRAFMGALRGMHVPFKLA